MKKKILSLSIAMLCSVITLLFTVSVKQVTANNSANQTAQIEEIINEVFDNVQIESCETFNRHACRVCGKREIYNSI